MVRRERGVELDPLRVVGCDAFSLCKCLGLSESKYRKVFTVDPSAGGRGSVSWGIYTGTTR